MMSLQSVASVGGDESDEYDEPFEEPVKQNCMSTTWNTGSNLLLYGSGQGALACHQKALSLACHS